MRAPRNPLSRSIFRSLIPVFIAMGSSLALGAPLVNIDPSTQVAMFPGPGQYFGFNEAHGDGMIGWTFHLLQPTTIAAVGWYDEERDGLSRAFQVGLWQDLNGYFDPSYTPPQLLGSPATGLTIPAGTAASLDGVWRIVTLPVPLQLPVGYYELGGLDSLGTSDVIKYVSIGPSSSLVTIGPFFYSGTVRQPGFHSINSDGFYLANGMELGPMLFTNVPEPCGVLLLCVTGMMRCARGRRYGDRS